MTKNIEKITTRSKHFDIISFIVGYWNKVDSTSFPIHVKGHQDDTGRNDLSRLELMNIDMDLMAKEILRRHISQNLPNTVGSFRYEYPRVLLSQVPTHSCLASNILTYCTTTPLIQYWLKKMKLNDEHQHTVSWDTFGGPNVLHTSEEKVRSQRSTAHSESQ